MSTEKCIETIIYEALIIFKSCIVYIGKCVEAFINVSIHCCVRLDAVHFNRNHFFNVLLSNFFCIILCGSTLYLSYATQGFFSLQF